MRRPIRAALVAACLPLLTTGCLQVKTVSADDPTGTTTPSPTGSPTGSPSPSGAPAPGGQQVSPPGTQTTVGQPLVVPIKREGSNAVARITVTAVTPAPAAPLKKYMEGAPAGSQPYYVKTTLEILSGRINGYYVDIHMGGITASGTTSSSYDTDSDYTACPINYEDQLEAGQSAQICHVEASPSSDPIERIYWDDNDTYYEGDGTEVSWVLP